MTIEERIYRHLERFPKDEVAGKSVAADVLLAYLYLEHDHNDQTEAAIVDSLDLERFIRKHAR